MDTKLDFDEAPEERRIVYVRPVPVTELPDEVQAQVPGVAMLYALHGEDGERLALVRDRKMAFALARVHDMAPVSTH